MVCTNTIFLGPLALGVVRWIIHYLGVYPQREITHSALVRQGRGQTTGLFRFRRQFHLTRLRDVGTARITAYGDGNSARRLIRLRPLIIVDKVPTANLQIRDLSSFPETGTRERDFLYFHAIAHVGVRFCRFYDIRRIRPLESSSAGRESLTIRRALIDCLSRAFDGPGRDFGSFAPIWNQSPETHRATVPESRD